MNAINNQPQQRETKLVDIPTFRGGSQDSMTWLDDFQATCTANHINDYHKVEILPTYLKGIAHT